ncbi:hypothetical protein HYS94_01240 [Candidatus Daviesbacteria bacterium]|nr:hypothetical protein [Candidatus Daviesbacteria bacterium]
MTSLSKYLKYLILVYLILFTIQPPLDLDLGWHLRYGEYFFQTGQVLKDNIISFVWPDYSWVQASWGYDLLLYQIFTRFSFFGVSLGASLTTLLIFILITYPIKRFTLWQYFFLSSIFLILTAPLYASGLRSQTPSALLFAITILITHQALRNTTKTVFLLPGIFLIWANLHGGFALGLLLLFVIWLVDGLLLLKGDKLNKKWFNFGIILGLSTLTPLINPWGIRIYQETFKHSSNIQLVSIKEWQPLTSMPFEAAITSTIVILLVTIGFLNRKNLNIPYSVALILSGYFAFSAIRFLIPFGIMATYFLAQNISIINWRKWFHPHFIWGAKILFILLLAFDFFIFKRYFLLVNPRIINFSWSSYCQTLGSCSEEITELMLKNPPQGNGYNFYDYGGYLSWRVPQVKTFLDGRMSAWEKDGQVPPLELGDQVIFSDNPIPFIKLDNQYHFKWAIVYTEAAITNYLESLVKAGLWQKIYHDSYFTYFVKLR